MTKIWAFNRRRLVDQIVYIRAESAAEARRKALTGDVDDTNDESSLWETYRRLPGEDEEIVR